MTTEQAYTSYSRYVMNIANRLSPDAADDLSQSVWAVVLSKQLTIPDDHLQARKLLATICHWQAKRARLYHVRSRTVTLGDAEFASELTPEPILDRVPTDLLPLASHLSRGESLRSYCGGDVTSAVRSQCSALRKVLQYVRD